ncbi:MAG: heavy-metal-associated domain-containing protein [Gammaproteobacteria bacterium]|nr:heavy-metal-associated domain-containing protein [Gammaproteobacteria bacterium]MDX5374219.1 heavy-metal-associated domain-containing protein [Gammaproteobacteria bacterium]
MQIEIDAQNIKCGGCASAISTGLLEDPRINEVNVDIASGRVTVEADGDIRAEIEQRLAALGYPPKG